MFSDNCRRMFCKCLRCGKNIVYQSIQVNEDIHIEFNVSRICYFTLLDNIECLLLQWVYIK